MTRAMNSLILTRAHYRRRYGNDAPEMSIPSRFLEEVPSQLIENLGGRPQSSSWSTPGYPKTYGGGARFGAARHPGQSSDFADRHYNYEDENQEAPRSPANPSGSGGFGASAKTASSKPFVASWMTAKAKLASSSKGSDPEDGSAEAPSGHEYSLKGESSEAPKGGSGGASEARSIDNIARFFAGKSGHGKPGSLPRPASSQPAMNLPASSGATNLKRGQRVRHSKYGEGTILLREGDGEDAKLTVLFSRHGMKKLMEKFANLQKI